MVENLDFGRKKKNKEEKLGLRLFLGTGREVRRAPET